MGGDFKLLDHPSDIGVLAQGPTREDALTSLSEGLVSIIADPSTIESKVEREFQVEGPDVQAQIINWLNEILFLFDTEGLLFKNFVVDSWNGEQLAGRAWGETFDAARHTLRTSVKAATYHQFEMKSTPQGWELRVFMDV